jgi:hypothetical protein
MTSRRVWSVLLGLIFAMAAFSPAAQAATLVNLSAHVTNTDGLDQAGTVCLELAGPPSSCGGSYIGPNGLWSLDWDVDADPGDYLIRVISSTMDGTSRWYVAGDSAGTTNRDLATVVHLGPATVPLHFDMVMPAIAKVTGKVVDTSAAGVPGLGVGINQSGMGRSTTSAAGGSFDFGYTRAGSARITVNGGDTYAGTQTDVVVPATGTLVVPDLTVQLPATIVGVVTDSVTGDPIPFADVTAWSAGSASPSYLNSAVTDATGQYRIGNLGNTPLVLRFADSAYNGYERTLNDGGDPVDWSPQTPITLSESETSVHDQLLVAKAPVTPPQHTLSGTVTDGSNPLVGIDVTAGELSTRTDRLGRWYLDAPDGAHTLRFSSDDAWSTAFGDDPSWSPEYYLDALVPSAATAVPVIGGLGQDNLDVSLSRAGRVSGTLTGVGVTPVLQHEIWVYDDSGSLLSHQPMSSGQDYAVEVPPGVPVHLVARGRNPGSPGVDFLPQWFDGVDTFADSTAVVVASTATESGKDFTLGTALTNQSAPLVSGTAASGHTLTATTGSWNVLTETSFTTTWLRDGVAVGTGSSYLVKAADAGRSLRARVTATNGLTVSQALSASRTVSRLASVVAVRGRSPKAGKVRLTVGVSAAGLTPTGTLTIKRGTKVVKRGVVLVNGGAVITLKRQPSGARRYTVLYVGSTQTLPSSRAVKVRVR